MNYSRSSMFGGLPPVVKNIIIINVLVLLAEFALNAAFGINLIEYFALYYPDSQNFEPYQYITHMFMHGGLGHLFFNMFALFMFGRVLEAVWGSKRFIFYFFVTGLGAAALHTFVNFLEFNAIQNALKAYANTPTVEGFMSFINEHFSQYKANISQDSTYNRIVDLWSSDPGNSQYARNSVDYINALITQLKNIPTVGASGAVFGILLAFGMLFPNTQLMLLFPPIPIKAKYFVIGYGAIELYLGFTQQGSNVAHFAHIGGMLFGFILIKYWNVKGKTFY